MKKTFATKWFWIVSHVGLPVTILLCSWLGLCFVSSYPIYKKLTEYTELFVANIVCIMAYSLYIVFCIICLIMMIKRSRHWKRCLFVQLFIFPLIPSIASAYNNFFLKYINDPYALEIPFSSVVLLYILEFCIFCLPTILILRKYSIENVAENVIEMEASLDNSEVMIQEKSCSPEPDAIIYCVKCGTKLKESANFCHVCGYRIEI